MTAAAAVCQRPRCAGRYTSAGDGELSCGDCGLPPVVSPAGLLSSPATAVTARAVAYSGDAADGAAETEAAETHPAPRHDHRGALNSPRTRRTSAPTPRPGSTPGSHSASHSAPRSGSGSGAGAVRGRLGAGLVTVPQVPRPDPRTAVLAHPEVPERKRFCSRGDCGAPVGRTRGGRTGTTEGFCTACGHPYSFVPKLRAGDLVHGQYEVAGCLAHGGLGWIYLAVDRAVSDRWVVLKGLLDTGDEEALAVAVSERRFLAEIEHANIVRIYNFVEHLDPRTGSRDGYLVMEYIGGKSLKEIANERRTPQGRRDPLPVEQACAYGIEALEALGHLHSRNLLYCDFKVDNAIQQQDGLKLIDMGAVRRMDDEESPIYGTVGYQAPEIAALGPSVASDLYTVARALAVLTFDFQGYTSVFADSLPDPEHIEVFRTYPSFHRLLLRATDPEPARRFASAEEMAEQLTGVLREVVAVRTGEPRPALSTLFGPELRVVGTELLPPAEGDASLLGSRAHPSRAVRRTRWTRRGRTGRRTPPGPPGRDPAEQRTVPGEAPRPRTPDATAAALALPEPRVDPDDPHAGYLAGLLSAPPAELLGALRSVPADSPEVRLRGVRALLETGDHEAARTALAEQAPEDGTGQAADWRVEWNRGLVALASGDRQTAALSFDAVHGAFPGEPAPKLALAVCAEHLGRWRDAEAYYRLVWTTDHGFVSAAFGLARVRLATGDRAGAVGVLESVPESSVHCAAARIAAVRARLRRRGPGEPLLAELRAAAEQVEWLADFGLDAQRREQLTTEVLGSALDWVLSGSHGARPGDAPASSEGPVLLGSPVHERGLRFGLERSYRRLARLAQRGEERIELVERANRFRPRTWV